MLSEYIFIGSTVAGLLWLRKTRPDTTRPIKVITTKYKVMKFYEMAKAMRLSSHKVPSSH